MLYNYQEIVASIYEALKDESLKVDDFGSLDEFVKHFHKEPERSDTHVAVILYWSTGDDYLPYDETYTITKKAKELLEEENPIVNVPFSWHSSSWTKEVHWNDFEIGYDDTQKAVAKGQREYDPFPWLDLVEELDERSSKRQRIDDGSE